MVKDKSITTYRLFTSLRFVFHCQSVTRTLIVVPYTYCNQPAAVPPQPTASVRKATGAA